MTSHGTGDHQATQKTPEVNGDSLPWDDAATGSCDALTNLQACQA